MPCETSLLRSISHRFTDSRNPCLMIGNDKDWPVRGKREVDAQCQEDIREKWLVLKLNPTTEKKPSVRPPNCRTNVGTSTLGNHPRSAFPHSSFYLQVLLFPLGMHASVAPVSVRERNRKHGRGSAESRHQDMPTTTSKPPTSTFSETEVAPLWPATE